MSPLEGLRALRERWPILVLAALLAAAAAYLYTKLPWVEPRWRSSVSIQATGRLDYGNTMAIRQQLQPLADEIRQRSLMRQVDQRLHTDLPLERLLERTKAEPIQDSSQLRVDVEEADPHLAEQLALEIADVYTRTHNAAEQVHPLEERVILKTLDRFTTPVLVWPQTRALVPAAALLGLVAAVVVVLGLAYLDDTLRSAEEAQSLLGLPVVGVVPGPSAGRRVAAAPPGPGRQAERPAGAPAPVGAGSPATPPIPSRQAPP